MECLFHLDNRKRLGSQRLLYGCVGVVAAIVGTEVTHCLKHDYCKGYTEVALPARVVGRRCLSRESLGDGTNREGVDLSIEYKLKIAVDGGGALEVDLSGEDPANTTIEEIIAVINATFGATIAIETNEYGDTDGSGGYISLVSPTDGETGSIEFQDPSDEEHDAL